MSKRERPNLRPRLAKKELLVAPGVFDGISARIADQMGFEALYMTGYGTVASHSGLPDAGIATYSDMVGRVAVIANGTDDPADRRRRYRLRRTAQRPVFGPRLRGGRRDRHPARGPGVSEKVRPHAGPPGGAHRGHGRQDQGRGGEPRRQAIFSSSRVPTRARRSGSTKRCAAPTLMPRPAPISCSSKAPRASRKCAPSAEASIVRLWPTWSRAVVRRLRIE